jgi:hypothetical protein
LHLTIIDSDYYDDDTVEGLQRCLNVISDLIDDERQNEVCTAEDEDIVIKRIRLREVSQMDDEVWRVVADAFTELSEYEANVRDASIEWAADYTVPSAREILGLTPTPDDKKRASTENDNDNDGEKKAAKKQKKKK